MKKLFMLLFFALFLASQSASANDNFLYSVELSQPEKDLPYELVLKTDHNTTIKAKVESTNSVYFDIKNTSLKENFSTTYENASGVESVMAQQIGDKVRVYVKGKNAQDTMAVLKTLDNEVPFSINWATIGCIALIALCLNLLGKITRTINKITKPAKARLKSSRKRFEIKTDLMAQQSMYKKLYSSRMPVSTAQRQRPSKKSKIGATSPMKTPIQANFDRKSKIHSRIAM